ncbi:unnamed protein product [Paramecium primaurelia]|nr:unnamed protein product [Paramecium primaurelia]
MIYKGNQRIFKEKLKFIHQTISIFYYKDENIQFSYRILEVCSQFNLLLALNILEFFYSNSKISLICAFMIVNPFIVFILRIIYKIIESIYRFRRINAIISQLLLIMILILPNLIIITFNYLRLQIQQENYLMAISYLVNILISQIIIEPISIFGRIAIYRLIASSLKEMELNPLFHLMHFFVMHSCLEEIFDEFLKI